MARDVRLLSDSGANPCRSERAKEMGVGRPKRQKCGQADEAVVSETSTRIPLG